MDIKREFESVSNLCHGCLSSERNLHHVTEEFSDLFFKLRNDNDNQFQDEQLQLCWECVATVKKLTMFQDRIKKAQVLLLEHANTYCCTGEEIQPLCLTSLTKIVNNSFNEIFYEELNDEEESYKRNKKIDDSNNKTHETKDKFKYHNLKKEKDKEEVKEEDSCMNTDDVSPEEDNKEVYIELKTEGNDNIKEEDDGLEKEDIDCNNVNYKENDNLVVETPTDYCEKECKIEKARHVSSTERKDNISVSSHVRKREKYTKFATITKNKSISTENYTKMCQTIYFSHEEYDDVVLKREREKLRNRLKIKCEKCKVTFLKNIDLLRHNSFVHNESSYPQKCAACETMIGSKENLSQHWTRVHTVMFKCTLCSELERNVADIKRHIREMHMKTYTCNTCGFACSTFAEFMKHYKTHEIVKCDHCGASFLEKSALINHITTKCVFMPVSCTICNQKFSTRRQYWSHNRMHHPELSRVGTSQELAYCVECDKQFANSIKYRLHLHTSVKHIPRKVVRVPCPECGKVFSKRTFMNNHYRFAHLKVTKHYCDKCNKYYTTGYGLRQHIERVHEKIPLPKNKICDLCGRGFTTNKVLQNHRRTHTGEKPYKCAFCPTSFAQQWAMQSHQKTQHNSDKINKSLK